MGTPLELIKYNAANGKFEVGNAALDTLRKVKGPVAVVAVCGRARQGKSFILNQLLLKSSGGGFQVGATHRPCTKGLWMWSSPQRMNAPDGSEHHLVLLDTEGIDAYDQTAQYSTQIFSLAVLLSSLFVYNQMGGIDESALDRLSLVTEMTKHVRVRAAANNSGNGNAGEEGLGEHSPAFLWLLRDFYLQLEDEGGRKITPRDYLETALRPVSGTGPSVAAKNGIRASITQLFPNRDCFTLVRPMHDEAALSAMDTLPREQLRPEFKQGVADLTSLIFSRAHPKRFGSTFMTGPLLAGLVGAYVGAINQGAVPTIATAWQGVAESECRRGCDAAEAAYAAAWAQGAQGVASEEVELEALHQRCLAAARSAYDDIAVGDEAIRAAHRQRYEAALAARYRDAKGRLLAEAAAAVNELLLKAAGDIAQVARSCPPGDLSPLSSRIASFVASYGKAAAGPTKWPKLAAFLNETWPAAAGQLLERQAAAARTALEAAQREAAELKSALAAEKQRGEQAERLHREASGAASGLQSQLGELQQQAAQLRAALDQKSAKVTALQAQMEEVLLVSERKQSSAAELAEARAAGAESRLAALEADAAEWRSRYSKEAAARVEMQGQRDQARDALSLLEVERSSVARERDAARAELAQLRADMQAESRAKTDMQARLDELAAEAAAARSEALEASHRAAAAAAAAAAAGSRRDNDENVQPQPAAAAAGGGGGSGRAVLSDAANLSAMTVQEIKDALTQAGYAEDVWALSTRKPAPKKAEWVELMRRRQDAAGVATV